MCVETEIFVVDSLCNYQPRSDKRRIRQLVEHAEKIYFHLSEFRTEPHSSIDLWMSFFHHNWSDATNYQRFLLTSFKYVVDANAEDRYSATIRAKRLALDLANQEIRYLRRALSNNNAALKFDVFCEVRF